MRIETAHCHVLGRTVTRVVDFEGMVDHVICPQYQRPNGMCRIKQTAGSGGPLARLLLRVDEDILGDRDVMCSLR